MEKITVELMKNHKFLKAPTGFGHLYISKEGWVADCANAPNGGGLLITSPDGVRYELTVTGVSGFVTPSVFYVKKITDKHGNWLSFDYQTASGKAYVVKCTASDGRLVTFTYAPNAITGTRVSEISANGQTWQYDYTSNGRPLSPSDIVGDFALAKVTRPDGTAWAYDYPSVPPPAGYVGVAALRFLGKVTRPEGGFTTYTHSYVPIGIGYANGLAVRITKKTISDKVNPEASWVYRYKYWESVGGSTAIGVSITDVADPVGGLTTYKHETPYLGVDAVEKPIFSQIIGAKNGVEFSTPFSISAL